MLFFDFVKAYDTIRRSYLLAALQALGAPPALIMSHFTSSEDQASPDNSGQIERFARVRAMIPNIPASLCNSSGIYLPSRPWADLARPGYALYGGNPTPGRPNPMAPVVSLSAPILLVREIESGARVGYNGQWSARRPTRLAVIPVGYADGIPRSAMGVADARRYRPYRSDLVLDVRQIEVALRKLRLFQREGADEELDLDATIEETGKNAGELEIVMRPPRKSNVRVILLMDVGGSMDPHIELVSRLFSAAKRASNIRKLETYYFHNCVYGRLWETEKFTSATSVQELFDKTSPDHKLVIVGDAAMHPGELLGNGDWDWYASGRGAKDKERLTGVDWLHLIADRYKKTAWLNPDPPSYWRGGTCEAIGKIFPMFHLSLDGLGEAVTHLSRGATRRR